MELADPYAWFADVPHPDSFLFKLFYSRSPRNVTGYSDQAFDDLLARKRPEGNDGGGPVQVARLRVITAILADALLVGDPAEVEDPRDRLERRSTGEAEAGTGGVTLPAPGAGGHFRSVGRLRELH